MEEDTAGIRREAFFDAIRLDMFTKAQMYLRKYPELAKVIGLSDHTPLSFVKSVEMARLLLEAGAPTSFPTASYYGDEQDYPFEIALMRADGAYEQKNFREWEKYKEIARLVRF